MNKWKWGVVLGCAWLLIAGSIASGQVAITGKIQGVVTDSSGAVVPGASLTVTGPALMTPRTTVTGSDGGYLFTNLPPGTYDLEIKASGFNNVVQRGIVLTPGFTATIRPQLSVGKVSETVEVSGAAPIVDIKSNTTDTTFDTALLQKIPSGRDPWSTVAQTPGETSSNFDVGGNQSYQQATMQIHGSRPGEQVYSFDGLRLNWPGSTGGYTSFYTDHDALQQFQVVSDNAPAEVGVGGIYMNMVPKSGSNDIHGMAAIYYDSAATEATIQEPLFNGVPVRAGSPIIMSRDTTAQLGGPIIKNRWWAFGSYRRFDMKESVLSVRNQAGYPISDTNHQSNVLFRSDWQITRNNRVNFDWWYNEQNRFARRDTAFAFVSQEASWRQIEPAYILEGQWTSVLSNNLVLDSRLGYMHQIFPLGYQPGIGATTALNRRDVGLSTETGAAPYQSINPAQVLAVASNASYYKGNLLGAHNFKFGFDTSTNRNGYIYTVNNGFDAIYKNGVPQQVIVYNTPVNQMSIFHETAAFGEDSWSITPRVTVNLGLRFEHFRTFNPQQSSPAATFSALFPTRTFAQSIDFANWNTVVPRVGVAFDITGKGTSVLRAGYGRYERVMGTLLAQSLNPNGFSSQTYNWTDLNGDGIPTPDEFLFTAGGAPATPVARSGGSTSRVDPKIQRPYSDEINVGYEQQVVGSLRVGVNYYYRTNKNQIGGYNMAAPPTSYTAVTNSPTTGAPIVNPLTGAPMTLYALDPALKGKTDLMITNVGLLNDNSYNAVEFTAVKRFNRKWQVLSGFTIQRSKGFLPGGTTTNYNDPNVLINRKNSILDYDSTYVFKVDATYQAPLGIASSVNFQHYSGYPLDPNYGVPSNFFNVGLPQGGVTVNLEPRGQQRLSGVNMLNLRLSRPTKVSERITVEPLVDFFNLLNANTVVGVATSYGPNFMRPVDMLNPFIARFGLKVTF